MISTNRLNVIPHPQAGRYATGARSGSGTRSTVFVHTLLAKPIAWSLKSVSASGHESVEEAFMTGLAMSANWKTSFGTQVALSGTRTVLHPCGSSR
jgi:hypothetical protein